MKDWSSERERYQLTATAPSDGSMVYMLKPAMRGTEPPHWLCTRCFDDGKKAILQKQKSDGSFSIYGCPSCKATLSTHWRRVPTYGDPHAG